MKSTPAVSNGKVYFGSNDELGNKIFLCINSDNGKKLWEYKTTVWLEISSPAISKGKVYFGSENGLVCLNIETGKKIYEYQTTSNMYSSPSISNGKIYFGLGFHLYCYGDLR